MVFFMLSSTRRPALLLIFIALFNLSFGLYTYSSTEIDDLKSALHNSHTATAKIETLYDLANVYKRIDPDSALYFVNQANNLLKDNRASKHQLEYNANYTDIYHELSKLYLKRGQPEKAKIILKEYIDQIQSALTDDARFSGDEEDIAMIYKSLAQTDSLLGDFANGLAHYKRYTQYKQRIDQARFTQEIRKIESSHQEIATKKEAQLLSTQNRLQELVIKERWQILVGFVAISIALTTLYFIVWDQYKLYKNMQKIKARNDIKDEQKIEGAYNRILDQLQIVLNALYAQTSLVKNSETRSLIIQGQELADPITITHKNRLYASKPCDGRENNHSDHLTDSDYVITSETFIGATNAFRMRPVKGLAEQLNDEPNVVFGR
ncbi:MAG: hypothetical protein AAFN93_14315 [Bacteroidota bacterium]